MKELLFVYGTLKEIDVQHKVIGRVVPRTLGSVLAYTLSTIEINGTTYPIAIKSDTGKIDGYILQVTKKDLVKLDEYETTAYQRNKVTLASGQKAWMYQEPN